MLFQAAGGGFGGGGAEIGPQTGRDFRGARI
jgi:hypothetical protein